MCAAAAEADLRDLAGRLRSAQAGMVQVLDGRASAEGVIHQQAALGRAVLGVAARLAAAYAHRASAHQTFLQGARPPTRLGATSGALTHRDQGKQARRDRRLRGVHHTLGQFVRGAAVVKVVVITLCIKRIRFGRRLGWLGLRRVF